MDENLKLVNIELALYQCNTFRLRKEMMIGNLNLSYAMDLYQGVIYPSKVGKLQNGKFLDGVTCLYQDIQDWLTLTWCEERINRYMKTKESKLFNKKKGCWVYGC